MSKSSLLKLSNVVLNSKIKNNFKLDLIVDFKGSAESEDGKTVYFLQKLNFEIPYTVTRFFSGELSVNLDTGEIRKAVLRSKPVSNNAQPVAYKDKFTFKVKGQVKDSDSLIELCMLSNAINNFISGKKWEETVLTELYLPYMFGSRGDRVMQKGGSFDLEVYSSIINTLGFDSIHCTTPHSQSTELLVNNLYIEQPLITTLQEAIEHIGLGTRDKSYVLVSPDAGATKRVSELAKIQEVNIVQALKQRSIDNASVTTQLFLGDIDVSKYPTAIIVDDILDGGRTFIETARELKAKGFSKVYLVIDHAMFSYGDNGLFDFIDGIYYTNEWDGVRYRLSAENSHKAVKIDV